jgi:putative ABC transport system substrate-binding protein
VAKTTVSAFIQALAGLGWADPRNVRMDLRWGGADINRIQALAQELVDLRPDIIVTSSIAAIVALQRKTRTIPIVFASMPEPVAHYIVAARLSRLNPSPWLEAPWREWASGNVTGFATFEISLARKWLVLLSEIAPGLKRAAIMFNPDTAPASAFMPTFETDARWIKVEPITAPVHDDVEIETAITALGREPGGGLVVMPDSFMSVHRAQIILAAARNKVPAVYASFYWAREGGLLSYGPDLVNAWRRAASYVDRILRGTKPGDLPVQFVKRGEFEMVVNLKTQDSRLKTQDSRLKTAKALGLALPPLMRLFADEVIEE